ncbi:MAG: protein-L-isoaspartate(D-aspartate) O-methyltransferase [Planctomycetes bacterium]|nr:protein-L-isoaspartate(D-aspartate) O-methyltransferase [Planctomycetota bacterium]
MLTRERTDMQRARDLMVQNQIQARGVKDARLLGILRVLPRHLFVPKEEQSHAYDDSALPIGREATISQPLITAVMTESLKLDGTERVLEIGTGSGYQTALLCELAGEVYSIEIDPILAERSGQLLKDMGYRDRLSLRAGNGENGWPEAAPFDRIVVTAAPEKVPPALLEQLAEGGRMVVPAGPPMRQRLVVIEKHEGKLESTDLGPVRFVPLRPAKADKTNS